MGRLAPAALAVALLLAGCTAPPTAERSPTPNVDIRQSKIDIAYTAIAEQHYASPTSRELLTAALDAFRAQARAAGVKVEVATPQLEDRSEASLADFRRFAEAARRIAAATPQVSADRFADAAIEAMLKVKPDCHAYYIPRRSSAAAPPGGAAVASDTAAPEVQRDEAGLEARIVGGDIGYLTWREFRRTGTYDITAEVRKALDRLLAEGARAWIFDLRGNIGGDPPQAMTSWFLDGQPIMEIRTKTGSAGVVTSRPELRLPAAYQLPIAIVLNDRGGSAPEVFALGLKENGRATVVGQRSRGCLGAIYPLTLLDGSRIAVPHQEFVGAVTGARYNNAGIPPDIAADDARAIDIAIAHLRERIAGRR